MDEHLARFAAERHWALRTGQRRPPPALPPPIVTREEAEENLRLSERKATIDYSWQDERAHSIQQRTTRMVQDELQHAHAHGDEAACRLYQRLALGAVLSDRVGERSSMWELPVELHERVAVGFEHTSVHTITICRYRQEGWAWHAAWMRQARVSHLFRSISLSRSESYVPGLGVTRVQSLQSEREGTVSECLLELTEQNETETAKVALTCVQELLQTVLDKPSSQRVRRLRRDNAALQRRLLSANAGEALLVAVGFEPRTEICGGSRDERQGSCRDCDLGQAASEDDSWFVLPHTVALPYLRMTLETVVEHVEVLATDTIDD